MDYDFELNTVVNHILKKKAKVVCIQLPDGLKPRAKDIADELAKRTKASILIWAGSCFGACDTPHGLEALGVDILVQWGHKEWK
jgi:2-(3-amino-3-carboxypropyl)histidine synthase